MMYKKENNSIEQSLFFSLDDTLNSKHPLYMLANKVDWKKIEKSFSPLYCEDNGRPTKPIRLMVGLILLRHLRNISDERVLEEWQENAYYQYFCGCHEFSINPPCNNQQQYPL